MESYNSNQTKKYYEPNWIRYGMPLITLILALAGFLQTVQRTTSFWDCGEFIATSYILGVPHPPGAPTFNIIGRVVSMLPIGGEIAWRVNLISVFSSAFAILFLFLIIREIFTYLFPTKSLSDSIISSFSAFSASLMAAFMDTFWFNAVEAEVYGAGMFILLFSVYLALIWYRERNQPGSDRYLIFIIFIMFFGIGAHMFTLLFFPATFVLMVVAGRKTIAEYLKVLCGLGIMFVIVFIFNKLNSPSQGLEKILHQPIRGFLDNFFMLFSPKAHQFINTLRPEMIVISFLSFSGVLFIVRKLEEKEIFKNWKYWVVFLQLTFVIYALDLFIWFNVFAIIAYSILSFKSRVKHKYRFLLICVVVAIIGYSTYLYIPIRSNMNPSLDENDPETWTEFKQYLERKQYGEPDIWSRITKRWASPWWQFMYMWNFLIQEYSSPYLFPFWLLFFLMGVYFLFRHSKNTNIITYAGLILFIATVGLIIYMNFSDGNHGKHAEVRDRDYFHTPTFLVFSMFMGLGFAGTLQYIKNYFKLEKVAVYAAIVFLFFPIITYNYHLYTHDRSKDYMPNDYGYNILISCPQDAILFTQGDNDTFPLWFLQEVKKFRKDVKVVNLSLLNATWYIKQLTSLEPKIEFGISDADVDRKLRGAFPVRDKPYDFNFKNMHISIPKGRYVRVQDIGVMEIIRSNYGKRPICYSMTVGQDGRLGLDKHFVRKAMVYEIVDTVTNGPIIDKETMEDLIINKFRYTNLDDSTIYLGKEGSRYVGGYASLFKELADAYSDEGNEQKAEELLLTSIEMLPYVGAAYYFAGTYFIEKEKYGQAIEYLQLGKNRDQNYEWFLDYYIGVSFKLSQKPDSALAYYEKAASNPGSNEILLKEIIYLCNQYKTDPRFEEFQEKAKRIIDAWIESHPTNNKNAVDLKRNFDQLINMNL